MVSFLMAWFVLLNILDLITTRCALNRSNRRELNPIIAYLLKYSGYKLIIGIKIVTIILMYTNLEYLSTQSLIVLNFIYSLAISYNIAEGAYDN